ncbi:MAG: DUF4118 domain-containing protein [Solobacterium sp.]|nr:DUF4118 domain-containing protein [Solobacterium sp.]
MTADKNAKQNILVCLSPSPSNPRVIRTAAKLFNKRTDSFIALYVGSLNEDLSEDSQLRRNIAYAESCGAEVQIIESSDIVLTISEFARFTGATDLFIGYSVPSHIIQSRSIPEQLISALPETDIHIIPDTKASSYHLARRHSEAPVWNMKDFLLVIIIMAIATGISYWFDRSIYSNSNIITIYILAVLIASILSSHQIYGILASVFYILLINFLFIEPRFTFLFYDSSYIVTYFVSFLAALITGTLAVRLKDIARQAAENAYQGKVLLDTSDQMKKATGRQEIIRIACTQLGDLLKRPVVFFSPDDTSEDQEETEILRSVCEGKQQAGAYTGRFSQHPYRYLRIASDQTVYGVLRIDMKGRSFTEFENTLLLSIINEFILALNNEHTMQEKAAAEIQAEQERYRAGLLRSLSHDLRTPLTSIIGNTSNLISMGSSMEENDKQTIYEDIREDSFWLASQMENILSMSRLENNRYIQPSIENVEDVIQESLNHLDYRASEHTITFQRPEEALFAEMDSRLILQVLTNLINNAIKHTPVGSAITIRCTKEDGLIFISIADDGDGIPDGMKEHIFDLYYTGHRGLSETNRSMGIGLNLCAMILQAHGQKIEVLDNHPKGTIFRFSLKAKELQDERIQNTDC